MRRPSGDEAPQVHAGTGRRAGFPHRGGRPGAAVVKVTGANTPRWEATPTLLSRVTSQVPYLPLPRRTS